jgi:hypothetical protein
MRLGTECGILSARVAHCESGAYNELITTEYDIIAASFDIEDIDSQTKYLSGD